MSILTAQLTKLSHLVSEETIEDYQQLVTVEGIAKQIKNCQKLGIADEEIRKAILRGRLKRVLR